MKYRYCIASFVLMAVLLTSGCVVGNQQVLAAEESQVKLRSIQSRVFDIDDKIAVLRAVISTLQDLNFIIDKADDELGTVSASKHQGENLRVTVTVKPHGKSQTLVRANAQYGSYPVEDPKPYQQFFEALSKSLFLQANKAE